MGAWDWIHAGLELGTYLQAKHAQKSLSDIKAATEMELARRLVLEAMRNFIFDVYRDIQRAEEHLGRYPQQVYIIARALERRLVDSGLSPDIFPDFHDKEFVYKVGRKVLAIAHEARGHLTRAQVQQSELAVKYIVEMQPLYQAISDRAARESLEATEEEWRRLRARHNSQNSYKALGIFWGFMTLCVALPLAAVGLGMMFSGSIAEVVFGLAFIGFAVVIALVTAVLLSKRGKVDPRYQELKEHREKWKEMLASPEEREEHLSLFGKLTSRQLRKMYKERMEFLRPLLGNDLQQYLVFQRYGK